MESNKPVVNSNNAIVCDIAQQLKEIRARKEKEYNEWLRNEQNSQMHPQCVDKQNLRELCQTLKLLMTEEEIRERERRQDEQHNLNKNLIGGENTREGTMISCNLQPREAEKVHERSLTELCAALKLPNTENEISRRKEARKKMQFEWKQQNPNKIGGDNGIVGNLRPRKVEKVQKRNLPELCRALNLPNTEKEINTRQELRKENQLEWNKQNPNKTGGDNDIVGHLQTRKAEKVIKRSLPELCVALKLPNTKKEIYKREEARKEKQLEWKQCNPNKIGGQNDFVVNVRGPDVGDLYKPPTYKVCKALSLPNSTEEKRQREEIAKEKKQQFYRMKDM